MGLLDWLTESIGGGGGGGMMPPAQGLDFPPSALRGPVPEGVDMRRLQAQMAPRMGAVPEPMGAGGPPMLPPQSMDMPREAFANGPMPPMGAVPEPMMPPGTLPGPPGPIMATPPPAASPTGAPPLPPPTTIGPPPRVAQAGPPPAMDDMSSRGMPARYAPEAPLPPLQVTREGRGGGGSGLPSISRALGLDESQAKNLRGRLAGGLKAVAENSHKPGLAAFSGGMGGALEGGEKAENRDYDDRIKALREAIDARKVGNEEVYKAKYLQYLIGAEKNRDATANRRIDEAVGRGTGGGGRPGAWNKPESQKVIDVENAIKGDREIAALGKLMEKALLPEEKVKAQTELQAKIAEKRGQLYGLMGIDPERMKFLQANPPGSEKNPHDLKGIRANDFHSYVKPGDRFINPADGKVYIAKPKPVAN